MGQALRKAAGRWAGKRGRWWAGQPEVRPSPGPFCSPFPQPTLSPSLPPQQMMTSWGRQFLVKHHPSLTTHRPVHRSHGPSSFGGGEALSLIHSPAGGGMGTSWAGLGCSAHCRHPSAGSLPSFAFSFPRPDLHGLPTPAALHQEGDLEPRVCGKSHLKNRDAGAWPGAGLKDCEQGTVLRSLLAGEEVDRSLLGGDPEEAGLEEVTGFCFAHPSRVGAGTMRSRQWAGG